MFCSNCGKTIRPDDDACPHCGARLGKSRFYGNTYTSSQVQLPVNELNQAPEGGMVSYTRTSYMSYDNQPEGDVYTNTTYRPLLSEEEDQGRLEKEQTPQPEPASDEEAPVDEPMPEEDNVNEFWQDDDNVSEPEPVDVEDAGAQQEDEPQEGVSTSPLPPIEKAAISPKVLKYMQEMEQSQQKQGGGLKLGALFSRFKKKSAPEMEEEYEYEERAYDLDGEEPAAEEAAQDDSAYFYDEENAQADASDEPDAGADDGQLPVDEGDAADESYADDGYAPEGEDDEYFEDQEDGFEEEKKGFLQKLNLNLNVKALLKNRILQIVVAAVLVIGVVTGGIFWLRFVTANRANIADVSYSTYTQGIELIKANAGEAYREERKQMYLVNTSYANTAFQEDLSALNALVPETPAENDQLFVNVLTNIQATIEDVIKEDADAELNDRSAARAANSERDWQAIENAVQTLEGATNMSQLTALVGTLDSIVVPEVTPTPEPTEQTYQTLQNGMMDSVPVRVMQNRLINLGFLDGDADGDFGPGTEKAVKAFQKAAGMTEDGIATSEVQEAMFAEDAPHGTLAGANTTPQPADDGSTPANPVG